MVCFRTASLRFSSCAFQNQCRLTAQPFRESTGLRRSAKDSTRMHRSSEVYLQPVAEHPSDPSSLVGCNLSANKPSGCLLSCKTGSLAADSHRDSPASLQIWRRKESSRETSDCRLE